VTNLEWLETMKRENEEYFEGHKIKDEEYFKYRKIRALEIIAETLINIYDRMCSKEGMNVDVSQS